jgi:TetR/AcrR family transcriptional regulator, transcriptional repressor for nem operon
MSPAERAAQRVRRRDPKKMRDSLLKAGSTVAAQRGLSGLSLNLVADEAGVAKGSLLHHYGDRATFLLELHRSWHDQIAAELADAMSDMRPGGERLLVAAERYLDICRRDRGLRTILFEARFEPSIAKEVARRNREFSFLGVPDFEGLGHRDPRSSAALFLGMVVEAAMIEHRANRRQPAIRRALREFVESR